MAQSGGAGPALEALLLAQRLLLFEQQREPFGMFETAGLGLGLEIARVLGVSEETARWRVCKARKFLARELAAYLDRKPT